MLVRFVEVTVDVLVVDVLVVGATTAAAAAENVVDTSMRDSGWVRTCGVQSMLCLPALHQLVEECFLPSFLPWPRANLDLRLSQCLLCTHNQSDQNKLMLLTTHCQNRSARAGHAVPT